MLMVTAVSMSLTLLCIVHTMQAFQPEVKRTLRGVALEAPQSGQNLNCPIITYSQLDTKQKIGNESNGQVHWLPLSVQQSPSSVAFHEGVRGVTMLAFVHMSGPL